MGYMPHPGPERVSVAGETRYPPGCTWRRAGPAEAEFEGRGAGSYGGRKCGAEGAAGGTLPLSGIREFGGGSGLLSRVAKSIRGQEAHGAAAGGKSPSGEVKAGSGPPGREGPMEEQAVGEGPAPGGQRLVCVLGGYWALWGPEQAWVAWPAPEGCMEQRMRVSERSQSRV